jgi:hypothetical protein
MTEMRIGDQTIRCDRDATAEVYRSLEHGFAEECGCIFCTNFAPSEIRSIRLRSERCLSNSALIRTKRVRHSSMDRLKTDAISIGGCR